MTIKLIGLNIVERVIIRKRQLSFSHITISKYNSQENDINYESHIDNFTIR